jgi:uncharacterized membrane protein
MQQPPAKKSFALRSNLAVLRLTRNWLRISLIFLTIYVSLPIAAPIMMRLGLTAPAHIIYTVYTPFCHQFGFRSFFLFGEQPVYPRAYAETEWKSYEEYTANVAQLQFAQQDEFKLDWVLAHKTFLGNEQMGYKLALCERDNMIWGMMLVGGLIYAIPTVRRKLRPVPIWLYFFVGVVPIGLDGFSQLLSYPPFSFWEIRETTPLFRAFTGALFGLMTAWLAFPYLELAMRDTRRQVERKLAKRGLLPPSRYNPPQP